jgi:hypothetical protein
MLANGENIEALVIATDVATPDEVVVIGKYTLYSLMDCSEPPVTEIGAPTTDMGNMLCPMLVKRPAVVMELAVSNRPTKRKLLRGAVRLGEAPIRMVT